MTQNVAKSGLEFFMVFFPPSTCMSVTKYLSFCILILLSLLVLPRVTDTFVGLHSQPPCPNHPPPPQAACFLAQILLLVSETARGGIKK